MLELEGQIKMEEMCFYPFLEDGKDSAAGIELGRSFHQMGTVNEEVRESDFVPLCLSTIKILSTYLTQEEVLQYVNEAIRLILCPGPVVPYQSVTLDVTSEDRRIGISLRETNPLRV